MIRGDYFQDSALFYTSFLWTISEMQIMLWKAKIFLHSCPCLSSLNFSSCRWIAKMEMEIQGWCWLFATRSSPLLTSFWKGDNRPHAWPFCGMNWSSCESCNFQSSILVSTDDMYKTPGFLHRQDVDVNLSNKAGLTALHLACQAGNTLLVCACHPLKEANSKELSSSLQSRDLARQNNFPRKHCCSRCCTQKNVHTVLDCLCDKVDGWVG